MHAASNNPSIGLPFQAQTQNTEQNAKRVVRCPLLPLLVHWVNDGCLVRGLQSYVFQSPVRRMPRRYSSLGVTTELMGRGDLLTYVLVCVCEVDTPYR